MMFTDQKTFYVIWLIGVLLPSIVSAISRIGRFLMGSFTLPGGLIYFELLAGMALCVIALLLCKSGWMVKVGGVLISFVILMLQVLVLGAFTLRSGGFDGIQ